MTTTRRSLPVHPSRRTFLSAAIAAAGVAAKDNVFFGVRAVDGKRRHSPAAFPVPQS